MTVNCLKNIIYFDRLNVRVKYFLFLLVLEDIVMTVTENAKVMYRCDLALNETEQKISRSASPIAKNDIQQNIVTSSVEGIK